MKNILRAAILGITVFSGLFSCAWAAPASGFQLKDIIGQSASLADFKGKQAVLLFFWTTWCPYCRKELQDLNGRYASGIQADGIQILAINVGESAAKVQNYVNTKGVNLRVLLDQDSDVAGNYRLVGVPTFVLVNSSGEVVFMNNYFPYDSYKGLLK